MKYYPSIDVQATGRRIRELRKQKHLRVEDISAYMGFETGQAVYKWQRGESLPTVDNLYALSILFGTTMEDILRPMECDTREEGESLPLPIDKRFKLAVYYPDIFIAL
ncbi:MAG: helix-turn-helix domain-containing protein [Lachnospiraceae bacterium]|nr:helix-turn-helix domain-containing protein [Lachnospiraceae bacterium]